MDTRIAKLCAKTKDYIIVLFDNKSELAYYVALYFPKYTPVSDKRPYVYCDIVESVPNVAVSLRYYSGTVHIETEYRSWKVPIYKYSSDRFTPYDNKYQVTF